MRRAGARAAVARRRRRRAAAAASAAIPRSGRAGRRESWGCRTPWGNGQDGKTLLRQVLQILAGLETYRAAGRDLDLLARPWVAADAALPGFHLEDAEAAQLDTFAFHHRVLHCVEHGLDGDFRPHLRDVGCPRDLVDDVHLDHGWISL